MYADPAFERPAIEKITFYSIKKPFSHIMIKNTNYTNHVEIEGWNAQACLPMII